MSDRKWKDNTIQFPRLLAEIQAIGLTPEQDAALCDAMDLDENDIAELFDRAQIAWQKIKNPQKRRSA